MDITSGVEAIRGYQATLQSLTALSLTSYMFPQSATLTDDFICDFIIVGGGTAGSVMANRLSENSVYEVCLFEAGGDPPLESIIPGLLGLLPSSAYDYNATTVNDNYANQHLQNKVVDITIGKMLGGTTSLDHLMMLRGSPFDYSTWDELTNSTLWSYDELLPYFKKSENLKDEEILNSTYGKYHGIEGYMKMKREPSDKNVALLKAFGDLGYDMPLDINNPETPLGFAEAILTIHDGIRQSAATTYLSAVLDRTNLHVFKNTKVVKVLFESDNAATGVQVHTADDTTITVNAKKEIILSAGAIFTPQLLMLSGIGKRTQLDSLGIPTISDLPVGQNLQDNPISISVYKMQETNATTSASNPHEYPIPTVVGLVAVDESQTYPDYVTFNVYFSHDSSNMIQFCSNALKYNDEICQAFYDAGKGRETLLVGIGQLHPSSRGYLELKSTDPADYPLVHLKTFADENDLANLAKYFAHYSAVENTDYFKGVGAELVELDFPECANSTKGTDEFWKCYVRSMSASIWNICGTCSMGTVVDARLNVKGVTGVRVVDASVIPNLAGAKITATVLAVAEKASDMIKEDWSSSSK